MPCFTLALPAYRTRAKAVSNLCGDVLHRAVKQEHPSQSDGHNHQPTGGPHFPDRKFPRARKMADKIIKHKSSMQVIPTWLLRIAERANAIVTAIRRNSSHAE